MYGGEEKYIYRIFEGKHERKRPHRRPTRSKDDSVKIDLKVVS
jgi:hypothetical protein